MVIQPTNTFLEKVAFDLAGNTTTFKRFTKDKLSKAWSYIGEPPLEVPNSVVVSEIAQDEEKLLFRQTTMEKWFVTFFLPCYLNSSLQKTVATMETDLIGCFSILLLIEN